MKKLLPSMLSAVAIVNVLDGYTSYLLATLGKGFEANVLFADFIMSHSLEYLAIKAIASILIILAATFITFKVKFTRWQAQVIAFEAVVAAITLTYCVINNIVLLIS